MIHSIRFRGSYMKRLACASGCGAGGWSGHAGISSIADNPDYEVDNHAGFAGQSLLWKEIFPHLIKKYQLIISSHSIFPLLLKRDNSLRQDNIICLYPDYGQTFINALADGIEYYNRNMAKIMPGGNNLP